MPTKFERELARLDRSQRLSDSKAKRLKSIESLLQEPSVEDRQAEAIANTEAIETLLAKLPHDDRSLLLLRYLDGLPRTSLAKAFGVPVRTVAKRLERALKLASM